MTDEAPTFNPQDLQWAALAIAENWWDHDQRALDRLTPEQRREQNEARWKIYHFIDDYRERAKDRYGDAVYHAPEWQVVAGMKDLLDQMCVMSQQACHEDNLKDDEDNG